MYGRCFRIAAKLLERAHPGVRLKQYDISDAAREMGYGETASYLPSLLAREWFGGASGKEEPALFFKDEKGDYMTRVSPATRPLSLIERRWLASVLRDPKMNLFLDDGEIKSAFNLLIDSSGKAAEPLFSDEDHCRFDLGNDSDDYADAEYRGTFRTILSALREKRALEIEYIGYSGELRRREVNPLKIEYSMNSDLFRLIYDDLGKEDSHIRPIRIRRIKRARITGEPARRSETNVMNHAFLLASDDGGAIERAQYRFADYKVRARNLSRGRRIILISYREYEEEELIEAILSFGPAISALEPKPFVKKIREKVLSQMKMLDENRY
jgi:hypothetical protein